MAIDFKRAPGDLARVVLIAAVSLGACACSGGEGDIGEGDIGEGDIDGSDALASVDPLNLVPRLGEPTVVVPSAGLPEAVSPQNANNNLDVCYHQGRTFLAFRSAPLHFASADTELFVVSSVDEVDWRFEGRFAMGTDLREPRLLSWHGELHLYFGRLGDDPAAFEPGQAFHSRWLGEAQWTAPEAFEVPTFIPWRVRGVGDEAWLIGYSGGEQVYEASDKPTIDIRMLASADGLSWHPAAGGDSAVVHTGGGSEADFALLDDGSLVFVVRNEAGEDGHFGSLVCRAPADDLAAWTCATDPRKYDSPLVFRAAGRVWLVGRRHVTADGHYDLGGEGPPSKRYQDNLVAYWTKPKRCSLWQVDPTSLTVEWVIDLPSKGDTCFASILPRDDAGLAWRLYNYSSPWQGDDEPTWVVGQLGPTLIYRVDLDFGPP